MADDFFYWMRDDYLEQLIDTTRPIAKDIPPWFNRSQYEPLRKASKACWYGQLLIRKALIYGLSAGQENSYLCDIIPNMLDKTRNEAIVDVTDRREQFLIGGAELTTLKGSDEERKKFARPVQRITPLAAIHRLFNLPWQTRRHVFNTIQEYCYFQNSTFTEFYSELDLDKNLMEPLDQFQIDGMMNLQIDPYAPIKTILDQVETLVKNEQKNLKKPQKFSSQEMYELGILPFLDLAIWAMEHGKRITYKAMAKTIYNDSQIKWERHIEQTTLIKARELLSADYLRRLHREIYS